MKKGVLTHNLGFPRIGAKRELKKATEAYWKNKISLNELQETGKTLRKINWEKQNNAGIDYIPSNDFSYYDQTLDMSCLLGVVPERFNWNGNPIDLNQKFYMARGVSVSDKEKKQTHACEMTKWFDTNYHYIVPEFSDKTTFKISSDKVFDEFQEAKDLGILTQPVLLGPVTYLYLGKVVNNTQFDKYDLLDALLLVYIQIIEKLKVLGAESVQLDEPIFSLDLDPEIISHLNKAYRVLSENVKGTQLMVANYFGPLRENLSTFLNLPVQMLHIDGIRGSDELDEIVANISRDKKLSVGIINGRNIWKTDLKQALNPLKQVQEILGSHQLIVSPSCSLMHSPVTLSTEDRLDKDLKNWLSFADEKLDELHILAKALNGDNVQEALDQNQAAMNARKTSPKIHNADVTARVKTLSDALTQRGSDYKTRASKQKLTIQLPDLPTTTIGSFPQTVEIRKHRAQRRKGEMTQAEYKAFLKKEVEHVIRYQEKIGLDMLVHGEPERNDMVEYFGEQLEGYAFTQFGWVQSYGSRYVKPPIIFGDVSRPAPMTVDWSRYAQSLTDKPVKGMLTGPVTMLQWSFVRDDQPRKETAKQIAFALRDEVQDLEAAGITAIQVDEPAFREGFPLRKSDLQEYLDWTIEVFKIATAVVKDETQIHTHMCYSEFNDIMDSIAALDADVISIEASRSKMELLESFNTYEYPNEIGPGVYDIHSPRIPSQTEIGELIGQALKHVPRERLWINPDCGLKTRGWKETEQSLKNMVEAVKAFREQ